MRRFLVGIMFFVVFIGLAYLGYKNREYAEIKFNTSSPVEEMYHRVLVKTIDSILDARFGPGCCEEDIDSVNANTFPTRFGGNFLPME